MTRQQNLDLWRTGMRAGMVAAVINLALYRFGKEWGVFSEVIVLPRTNELTLAPLLAASVVAALTGTLIFQLLSRRLHRPLIALFGITLGTVLLCSFGPVAMRSWTDQQVLYVNLMHLVVAVSTVVALWHWERTRRPEHHREP
jgi:membrane protein DedA with SNARE-associated domain